MLPLKDLNRSLAISHVNRWLLALNLIVFTTYWLSAQNIFFDEKFALEIADKFVMIPAEIVQGQRPFTLLTSMFMHADWLHLFGNMLFLYVFGDNIEGALGHTSYLIFYLVSGLVASFAHVLTTMLFLGDLTVGVVGASGAISGVLGAYFVLYPKAKILTFVFYLILPIPAVIFLGFWFVMQWLYGVLPIFLPILDIFGVDAQVAYWAHIGGFIAGMVVALTVGRKRKKVREARLRL